MVQRDETPDILGWRRYLPPAGCNTGCINSPEYRFSCCMERVCTCSQGERLSARHQPKNRNTTRWKTALKLFFFRHLKLLVGFSPQRGQRRFLVSRKLGPQPPHALLERSFRFLKTPHDKTKKKKKKEGPRRL